MNKTPYIYSIPINIASMKKNIRQTIGRRRFVQVTAATALGFTILPRHVLGGKNYIAPSDKITLAYIGCGTQGIRELLLLLANPQFQVVAVADPNKQAIGYKDWSKTGLLNAIRSTIKQPDWSSGGDNTIPGGRDNGKSIVDTFYANNHPELKYTGCTAYADARALLEKERDLDAVKIMTPDHLHGVLATAAIKKGKHVLMHKPLSNRLVEGKKLIELARNSKSITHLIPWDSNGSMDQVMTWINGGAIGTLSEVHNWTNRPVWPQYPTLPTDKPPIPDGLDWELWLGPEADRPYSPDYTNMVFRGWYDFGGGSMADWGCHGMNLPVRSLKLDYPIRIEPDIPGGYTDSYPKRVRLRYDFAARGAQPPVTVWWYDGGRLPVDGILPGSVMSHLGKMPDGGVLLLGDKGFTYGAPHSGADYIQLAGENNLSGILNHAATKEIPKSLARSPGHLHEWVNACAGGPPTFSNFETGGHLTEIVLSGVLALRAQKGLDWDGAAMHTRNAAEAEQFIEAHYRPDFKI